MPFTVPAGLLSSPTQCTAVLIQRQDGVKFGLTDATVPFTFDGVDYQVLQGGDTSNVHSELGTGVDDFEVRTILDDALNYVTSSDVRGTRYENSWWTLMQIDYMNPGNGALVRAAYRLGKVKLADSSQKFELLGLLSLLKQSTGRVLTANCDVMRFGDKRCDPGQTLWTAMSTSLPVGAVIDLFTVDFFGGTAATGYYSFGDATFTAGENNGLEGQIKEHTAFAPTAWSSATTYAADVYVTYSGSTYLSLQAGNTNHAPNASPTWWLLVTGNPANIARIVWRTPPPYPIAVGDTATLCFGCDRRKVTCQSVTTSNPSGTNIENFKGFYLPSPDVMLVVGKGNVQ